jgi:hypothetical protein
MGIPSATINLSNNILTTTTTSVVTISFSEAVTGFTVGDIAVSNATLGTLTTTDNINFTVTMTGASNVLDNSNTVSIADAVCTSVSTSQANTAATSTNYTVNTVEVVIDPSVVTDGTASVTGDGVFDVFMQAIAAHLKVEYDARRITSDTYPTVYLGALQTALTQAVTFSLQRPLIEKQANSEDAKKALIERQTKGFDDDAKQKLLKQALDSWSVAYSVAQDANSIPDAIKVNPIDSIMKNAMDSLAIVKGNNPLGEI